MTDLIPIVQFPQFPQYKVLACLVENLSKETSANIKLQLRSANEAYDYCFCNTKLIISMEHLYNSIHKSISNYESGTMQSNTLYAEILLNLSPVNVISDAIKRFGILEDCSSVIVIKILKNGNYEAGQDLLQLEKELELIELITKEKPLKITDHKLYQLVDLPKFRKIYKLNDAKFEDPNSQGKLTRLAIGACILRGY